jgi:hypothetical protein
MKKLLTGAVFALVLGAGGVAPSFAEGPGESGRQMGMMGGDCPMMAMMGRGGGGMMGHGGMGERHAKMGAMADGRLAYLKGELEITDAQMSAWTGYADAVKAQVNGMQGMHETMMGSMTAGTAIERMDTRIAGMSAMVDAMRAVKPALVALYEVLTPEQKAAADQLIGNGCGAM